MEVLDSVSIMKGIFGCLTRKDDTSVRKGPGLSLQQLAVPQDDYENWGNFEIL